MCSVIRQSPFLRECHLLRSHRRLRRAVRIEDVLLFRRHVRCHPCLWSTTKWLKHSPGKLDARRILLVRKRLDAAGLIKKEFSFVRIVVGGVILVQMNCRSE